MSGLELSFSDVQALAASAAKSGVCGTTNPDECVVRILRGVELGLSPMAALGAWHNMKGNLVLKSDLHVAVCLIQPVCARFEVVESTDEQCVYAVQRRGGTEQLVPFSMADAKKAGLLSNATWQKYPAAMLRARCGAKAARQVFPDIVGGLYDEHEGREIAEDGETRKSSGRGRYKADPAPAGAPQLTAGPEPIAEGTAELIGPAPPPGPLTPNAALAAIESCQTMPELEALNVRLRAANAAWPAAERLNVRQARDVRAAVLAAREAAAPAEAA